MTLLSPPDAVATRIRILDVAERLFRRYGYDKTTVADMARELGMSTANVYRFFASKLAIVEGIAIRMFEERQQTFRAIADGPGTPSERLRNILVDDHLHTVRMLVDDPKVHDIVDLAVKQEWASTRQHVTVMADVLERLVREGIAAGEFAVADPRRAAVCARQAFVSLIHPMVIVHCGGDPERADAKELADFIIRSLRPPV